MIRWISTALIVYILVALVSESLRILHSIIPVDTEILSVVYFALTSTQQFFYLAFCNVDLLFNYDTGFQIVPFILGAVVWVLVAIFLCYMTRNKISTKERLHYSGKILMLMGSLLGVIGSIATVIYANLTGDFFLVLLFMFLLVIFISMFIIGLVLILIANKFS